MDHVQGKIDFPAFFRKTLADREKHWYNVSLRHLCARGARRPINRETPAA